jgi:hypothetical protein
MPIWLIQLVVGVILSVASTLYQQSQQQTQKAQERRPGFRGTVQTGGKTPRSFLVGTIAVPGKQVYWNSWGSSGGTPNAYAVDVLSFGDLPITAFTGLWVNTASETVSGSGHVTQGYPVTGDKAGYLWAEFFDGTQTTVNTYLNGKFGSDADRPWSSDMIGRGIPYLTLTALISDTVWTGFPTYMAQFQGIKLYDPRLDSTAGGSGSQRWATPSTWAFSDNNMVIIYNILRGIHYAGDWVWGGRARAAQLPYAAWAAAMDACDENVTLDAGGTEKRFRAGREVFFSERPADVIGELLAGCTGRLTQTAGAWYPLVGVPDSADGSFTDNEIIITEGMTADPFPNLDEVINGATGTYLEPSQAWEAKETAPYYSSTLEAADDDRQQLEGLDLGTTFSGTQAQRILKATVEESRRFKRHVLQLRPSFGQYRPLQVLAWTSTSQSYTAKLFLITAKTELPNGNIIVGLQEIDPTDYDWTAATDEKAISFAPLTPIRPAPQAITGFAVAPYTGVDADANPRRPGFEVSGYGANLVDVRAIAVQARLAGTTGLVVDGEAPYDPGASTPSVAFAGGPLISDTEYEVRGKLVPFSGRETTWSNWLTVTTPLVPEASVTYDDLVAIAGDVLNAQSQIRSLVEAFKHLGTLLEATDRENFTLRNTLFREISVKLGDLEASFTEVIEVAIGPGGAIAVALESLYAAMGGNTSEVNVRWEAAAAPSGYSARYAITAAVNDETYRAATFFLDVPADTGQPTRIGFMAGQTVFFTSGGDPIALMDEDGHFKSANGAVDIDMINGDFSITAL